MQNVVECRARLFVKLDNMNLLVTFHVCINGKVDELINKTTKTDRCDSEGRESCQVRVCACNSIDVITSTTNLSVLYGFVDNSRSNHNKRQS